MTFAQIVDSIVGIFSPKAQAQRQYYREKVIKGRYAAAKTLRQTGDWSPGWKSVNDLLADSNATIRHRVRELVRNFPAFKRAIDVLTDYTVGHGIEYQPRVKLVNGRLNKALNQKLEDAWNWWSDEADYARQLHLYEMMRLAKRQDVECGEFFLVRKYDKDPSRYLQLSFQMYEADWLADSYNTPVAAGNKLEMGVEKNDTTGRVVAYHFVDPDTWGKSIRVDAANVIHGFETLRPGQLRGVSPLTAAVLLAHDLGDYMDAEIDAAKLASRYLAFITASDIPGFQAPRISSPDTETDTVKRLDEIETALVEYLQPGEEVKFAQHDRGGGQFEAFSKFLLRLIAIATHIPYEILSGDYSGLNYTSLRGVRNDMMKHFIPYQKRQVRHFCTPIQRMFLDQVALENKVALPRYYQDPWFYLGAYWQPPGLEPIDPLREGKADTDRLNQNLMSPQEITARRGRNYEDVLTEIEEAKRMREDHGLAEPQATPSTSTANNPAAVEGQDNEDKV